MNVNHNPQTANERFQISRYKTNKEILTSAIDYNRLLLSSAEKMKTHSDLVMLSRDYAKILNKDSKFNKSTPFQDWLQTNELIQEIDEKYAKWRIPGRVDERGIVMEDVTGVDEPGLGGFLFDMKISLGYLKVGDKIWVLSHPSKGLILKCQSAPQVHGAGYIYKWEYVTDDKDDYINKEKYLKNGTYILKAPSDYGEGTKDAGSLSLGASTYFTEMRTPLMKSRYEITLTDRAYFALDSYVVNYRDKKTGRFEKENKMTLHSLEALALMEIDYLTELWDTYGRQTYTMIDSSSQKETTTSAGLFQYMEMGHRPRYNPETDGIDTLDDKVSALWVDKTERNSQHLTLRAGKMFIKWFNDKIIEKYGNDAIQGTYTFSPSGAVSFHNNKDVKGYQYSTYQFTRYNLQPWGYIDVVPWDMLNDRNINVIPAHKGIYPASSWEAFSFNGVGSEKINVLKLSQRGQDKAFYKWGAILEGNVSTFDDTVGWMKKHTTGLAVGNMHNLFWMRPDYL